MKLNKIYSNRQDIFTPVVFAKGVNVILGRRVSENAHNLGKSTLGALIDFCLLKSIDKEFFLLKEEVFNDFVFYLEISIENANVERYLTIRRPVSSASKISFMLHTEPNQNYVDIKEDDWNHPNVPFERAHQILAMYLMWDLHSENGFRKLLHYMLRNQRDYDDVAKVQSLAQGKHKYWKPFVAGILGFDSDKIMELYEKRDQKAESDARIDLYYNVIESREFKEDSQYVDKINELNRQIAELETGLETLNFLSSENSKTEHILRTLDDEIGEVNKRLFALKTEVAQIDRSIEPKEDKANVGDIQRLYNEIGVVFPDALVRDFESLVSFRRAITQERNQFLRDSRKKILSDVKRLEDVSADLNRRRAEALVFIRETSVNKKFRIVTKDIIRLKDQVLRIENDRKLLQSYNEAKATSKRLSSEIEILKGRIKKNVKSASGRIVSVYSSIQDFFSEFIQRVLNKRAEFEVYLNSETNLEFDVGFRSGTGVRTMEDSGHSYKKMMCVAFDLAVLSSHLTENFPRFVFHDGVFESIDDNIKERLFSAMFDISTQGIQQIITLIDSDIPHGMSAEEFFADRADIVLELNDAVDGSGLLFKQVRW